MTVWRMPLLVWANATTSALVVFGTPFIAGSQFMNLFDRVMGTNFFNAANGGDVLMYQHVFWFYSHPAVYIMMLPGFGIVSEVIATFSRKPIFGYRAIAFSTVAIAILGFGVWAHHMFVSGMASWIRIPMMMTTVLIAVPDRHQDLLVARDDVGRKDPPQDADAVRDGLHRDVHHRRPVGHLPRRAAVRHRDALRPTSSSPTSTTCSSAGR